MPAKTTKLKDKPAIVISLLHVDERYWEDIQRAIKNTNSSFYVDSTSIIQKNNLLVVFKSWDKFYQHAEDVNETVYRVSRTSYRILDGGTSTLCLHKWDAQKQATQISETSSHFVQLIEIKPNDQQEVIAIYLNGTAYNAK